jgi:hypothetical protein
MEEDDNGSELSISVVDDAIIVTMPGTSYSVSYHKRNDPWLLRHSRQRELSHQQMDISRPSLDRSQ